MLPTIIKIQAVQQRVALSSNILLDFDDNFWDVCRRWHDDDALPQVASDIFVERLTNSADPQCASSMTVSLWQYRVKVAEYLSKTTQNTLKEEVEKKLKLGSLEP